ncbi:MAG TPA: DUF6519 domain-containing protein [Thermoanaerobaculia bacterium]|nr:DUF6519 domain-containing protein [Thermoanaerobaculia bacterium]
MKTHISRAGFRADRRYSGVYQQQGRMITDRDWNELVDILKSRVDDTLVDVIGSGAPEGRGATIQLVSNRAVIVPGVVYAGGVEAQVAAAPGVTEKPFSFTQQADFPGSPNGPAVDTPANIYVDVWERPVVSLEDEDLRDPALHGADTCTRTQTMAQVKWCRQASNPENPAHNPPRGNAGLTVAYVQGGDGGGADPCDPQTLEVDPAGGDFLLRVEIHDVHYGGGSTPNPSAPERVVVKWSRENGAEQYTFADVPDWFTAGAAIFELFDSETEKHLGFHMPAQNGWAPKRATLMPALPPASDKMVRRWDGYAVAVLSANVWGLSNVLNETPDVTAPGATLEVSGGKLTVLLSDLELTLDLAAKVFLAGDSWMVPVRRATYQAGAKLLDAAQPTGIVHRYVTLAELTATGLRPRTAAEQRRLAFPRLTDLDAGDMGYATSCGSGLFNANHDTVKKALDRLCEIAAQHVSYTKPGDTSVFRGNNPLTVAQALNLLADVKADDIGFTTTKDSSVDNVHEALDALFNRQAGSGNRFTIGNGGDFGSVGDALNALHSTGTVALELLPGTHTWPSNFDEKLLTGDRVSLSGLGTATQLVMNGVKLEGLALFEVDRLSLVLNGSQLALDGCREVLFTDSWIQGQNFFTETGLIEVTANLADSRLLVRGCIVDALPAISPPWVDFILGLVGLSEAYALGLRDFEIQVKGIVESMAALSHQARLNIVEQIQQVLDFGPGEGPPPPPSESVRPAGAPAPAFAAAGPGDDWAEQHLPANELTAYKAILGFLSAPTVDTGSLERAFQRVRKVFMTNTPGTALVLNNGRVPAMIEGNDIRGLVSLYGPPGKNKLDLTLAWSRQKKNVYHFGAGSDIHLRDNRLTGIRVSDTVVNWLEQFNPNDTPVVFQEPIRHLVLTDNRIDEPQFELFAGSVSLSSTYFTVEGDLGWILSENAVYVGNRGGDTQASPLVNDLSKNVSVAATLRLNIFRRP